MATRPDQATIERLAGRYVFSEEKARALFRGSHILSAMRRKRFLSSGGSVLDAASYPQRRHPVAQNASQLTSLSSYGPSAFMDPEPAIRDIWEANYLFDSPSPGSSGTRRRPFSQGARTR